MSETEGGHVRLYRSLLRIYPSDYRVSFAAEMVQLFGDQLRDDGALAAWACALVDLPSTAVSERLRRNRKVAHSLTLGPTRAVRSLGALGILGGAVLILAFVVPLRGEALTVRLILFNLGALAVIWAVHGRHAYIGRKLSWSAALPALAANAIYLGLITVTVAGGRGLNDVGPLFTWAATAMWLANAWFAVVAVRLRVVTLIGAVALLCGSFAWTGLDALGLTRSGFWQIVPQIGILLSGLGWVVLGLDVALRRRPVQPASGG